MAKRVPNFPADSAASKRFSPPPSRKIWTVPNFISFLRIASIPFIAWLIASHHLVSSLIVMALSGASDGLDGYIARKYNQVTLLGQVLDPIADRLLIACSVLALAIAQIIPWWIVVLVVARDMTMFVELLILAQHDYGPLPVHFVGKTGTFMLMAAIPSLIVSHIIGGLTRSMLAYYLVHCLGLALCWWGIGLYWTAGIIYIIQGHRLLEADRHRVAA